MGLQDKLVEQLSSGVSPESLATAVACGAVGGVFPIPGVTTVAVLALAFAFRLPRALVAVAYSLNLMLTPLNLATVIPFIKAGEWMFAVEGAALDSLLSSIQSDPLDALRTFGVSIVMGIVCWAALSPALFAVVYYPGVAAIRKLVPAKND